MQNVVVMQIVKMADINIALLTDQRYQHFKAIYRGFSYVGNTLETYTEQGLKSLHQRIFAQVAAAALPLCQNQCSRLHGIQLQRWCGHCDMWRQELIRNGANKRCNWRQTNSWEWHLSYENIVSVFLPSGWTGQGAVELCDISTVVNIWRNCHEFNIDDIVLKDIQILRNCCYGHNPRLKCTVHERNKVFNTLKRLINDPDITTSGLIHVPNVLQDIDSIKVGGDDTIAYMQDIDRKLSAILENQQQTTWKNVLNWMKSLPRYRSAGVGLVVIVAICVGFLIKIPNKNDAMDSPNTCISENYTEPFSQDLPLFDYISGHEHFVGRDWLFTDLHSKFTNISSSKRGIILFAEMGYGKSAVVKHLICTGETKRGGLLRKHVIGYHVCRFDVPSTRSPDVFIRRIIGFIAAHSQQFKSAVSSLGHTSIIFDRLRCKEDPVACIDQGLKFPFEHFPESNTSWIIVIDAFDECFGGDMGKYNMFDVLFFLFQRLPDWIKLFITSRESVLRTKSDVAKRVLGNLEPMFVTSNDMNNRNDIKLLLDFNAASPVGFFSGMFSNKRDSTLLSNIVNRHETNFLYTTHVLRHWKHDTILTSLPPTLESIYELDFDRIFGLSTDNFNSMRDLLEVLCASIEPKDNGTIFNIITYNQEKKSNMDTFHQNIDRLSEYISRTPQGLMIKHYSIHQWLTSSTNTHYKISLYSGHTKIARYLLGLLFENKTVDIVNLAVHVSKSNCKSVTYEFKQYAEISNKTLPIMLLKNLIWTSDSLSSLVELLLSFYNDMDEVNEGGVTPAFVAATKGHINNLKVLVKHGANISFVVDGPDYVRSFDVFEKIKLIKNEYFWGYSLLHIASQNGHDETVRFILQSNKHLVNVSNGVGLRAIDLACENGHIAVVKTIRSYTSTYSSCLYYASLNERLELVKHLISDGLKFKCTKRKDASKSFDLFFKNEMNDTVTFSIPYRKQEFLQNKVKLKTDSTIILHEHADKNFVIIRPRDIFWKALGYSPLHAAAINGHADIANVLLENFPESINCRDSLGRIPLFTSIILKQNNVFKVLVRDRKVRNISNVKCKPLSPHLNSEKLQYIVPQFDPSDCPENSSISHILAIHGDNKMISDAVDSGVKINCIQPDASKMTPLHYAASMSNSAFAKICTKTMNYVELRRLKDGRGSTIFHVAASNGSLNFLKLLARKMHFQIPQVLNDNYITVLEAVLLKMLQGRDDANNVLASKKSLHVFKWLVEDQAHDIVTHDYGHNILHIALQYGHWDVIKYMLEKYPKKTKHLLLRNSTYLGNPISYSIEILRKTSLVHVSLPDRVWEMFNTTKCRRFETVLTPQELSIYFVLKHSFQEGYLDEILHESLSNLILKSESLTFAVLDMLAYSHINFTQHILFAVNNNVPTMSLLAIAHYRPEHECGKPLTMSPMHQIMRFSDDLFSRMPFHLKNYLFKRTFGFKTKLDVHFFSCADRNGFNLLHRALQYGNFYTVKYLLKRGMPISNDVISVQKFFHLGMFVRMTYISMYSYTKTGCSGKDLNALEMLDSILSSLFKKVYTKIEPAFICKRNRQELSFVHYVAINGFTRLMKHIDKYFGGVILECLNLDGISPLYLAKLFNHEKMVSLLNGRIKSHQPIQDVEAQLIVRLLHAIPLYSFADPYHCLINPSVRLAPLSVRSLYKTYQCYVDAKNKYALNFRLRISYQSKQKEQHVTFKRIYSADELKWNKVLTLLHYLSILKGFGIQTRSDDSALKLCIDKLVSDINLLIETLGQEQTRSDRKLLRLLHWSKRIVRSGSPVKNIRAYAYALQQIVFHILSEFKVSVIDDYVTKHPTSILGMNSRAFPLRNIFARSKKHEAIKLINDKTVRIGENIHRYNYLNIIRRTSGYTFMSRSIMPESLLEQFNNNLKTTDYGIPRVPFKVIEEVPNIINQYEELYIKS